MVKQYNEVSIGLGNLFPINSPKKLLKLCEVISKFFAKEKKFTIIYNNKTAIKDFFISKSNLRNILKRITESKKNNKNSNIKNV